ncbi:MAG: hypothetical protein ACKVS9_15160 [Phycisphaerae bacterium]
MMEYTADAEALFRNFARRHSFSIEKVNDPEVELLMRVPAQPGLSFELTLGLQNGDELNIGFEEFWSYFFPFDEKTRRTVVDALDALVAGECRLAIHTQLGRVVKHVLERRHDGRWRSVYTAIASFQLPFLGTGTAYTYNECARSP